MLAFQMLDTWVKAALWCDLRISYPLDNDYSLPSMLWEMFHWCPSFIDDARTLRVKWLTQGNLDIFIDLYPASSLNLFDKKAKT